MMSMRLQRFVRARAVHLTALLVCLTMATGHAAHAAEGNVDLPRYPSISPDGEQVVFSWRGDLWKVPITGGLAVRMTSHPGDDLRSAWSPDGKRIAFNSDRDGFTNLYIMNADGTGLEELTHKDRPLTLTGFGVDADGHEVLTFDGAFEGDVYRSERPYMISTDGGDIQRVHDAFGSFPVVSPDGEQVAFTRGGYYTGWDRRHYMGPEAMNVWVYDRDADTFTQLTEWDGNDGNARWGGERTLLYMSDRELDCVNLYRMSAEEGEATSARLTNFDVDDVAWFDVSANGSTVVFSVWDTLYSLDLNDPNARPRAIAVTASEDEMDNYEIKSVRREVSEAALSPDGKVMAMVAYGEVFVQNTEEDSPTRRVTHSHARENGITWSPDGLKLYFVSDETGREGIYAASVRLTREEAREGFEALQEDAEEEKPEDAEPEAVEEGDGENDDDAEDEEDKEEFRQYDPDRWQDAVSFTLEPVVVNEHLNQQPSFSPDGTWLAYKRGLGDLVVRNMETGAETELVTGWDAWMHWSWGPDSKHIAYTLNDLNYNADIWIAPIDGSADPVNVTQHPDNDFNPVWSADGKILSFVSERINEEFDVWMIYLDKSLEALTSKELEEYYEEAAAAAKKRKPLKVAKPEEDEPEADEPETDEDSDDAKPQAAEDEDAENGDDADGNGEDANENDDEDAEEDKELEPLVLDLEDAYRRVRRVTSLSGDEMNNEMTPGGDMYVFSANLGDGTALYSIKWNGEDRTRITGNANVQHLSLTGERVVFVDNGQAGTVNVTGGDSETYSPDEQIRIDLQKQSSQKFLEAARALGTIFYHPTMKGLDWPALTAKYHALAKQTRTADEFNDVANRFLGELNASHLGIRAPGRDAPGRQASGRIGVRTERVDNGLRVIEVVPDSPADRGTFSLEVGDVITEVEFEPIGPRETMDLLLEGKVNEETAFTIERPRNDGTMITLTALITPTSYNDLRQLIYLAWQERNAALASEWSDGKLGYIHMQGMSQPSLDEFERDLFAAAYGKDGLVLDVRNNGGGWTTDRVLASIMVQEHAYTLPRGIGHEQHGHYPQDRLFIQRYLMPMNLLCNEKSFSNAEIMSHAFKTLERGNLVGEETYGGVISTGGTSLIDGTFVRLPLRGWFLLDQTDMENHGAVPDIRVPQTPEDEVAGVDAQLRAAVEDLLTRVD